MNNNIFNQNFSIKKISHSAIFLVITILFTGCASVNYKNRRQNNVFAIYSDNFNEYKISIKTEDAGFTVEKGPRLEITKFNKSKQNQNTVKEVVTTKHTPPNDKSNEIVMHNFRKEGIKINLSHPYYDTIQLEIKRKIRPGALAKDIGLSLFTLGLPLLVDGFKSDFYKIKKESRVFRVHFEYKQSYMRDEYMKIANSMEPQYFNEWIAKFPKSNLLKTAINTKDSVELVIAISKGQESAIDEFISSHNGSNFLNQAVSMKKDMSDARELFKNACINNTVESYEDFLSNYPNSLHNKEAHLKLVDAAEKRALESRSSEKIVEYITKYLKPNAHYITELSLEEKNWSIGKSESDIKFVSSQKLDDKNSRLTKALDELTIKELGALNSNIDYSAYSKMWKKYISLVDNKDIKPFLNSFSQTESYSDEICDVLFNTLKEANTKEKQKVWEEKTLSDFPKFDSLPYMVLSNGKIINNIFIRVLEQQKKGSAQIKLYDVNFIKNSDVIQKYFPLEKIKNYTYKNNYYTTLEGVNVEELNYSKGELNGVNRALRDNVIDITITIKGMTKDISYYQMGKLVKTTYYPDDYRDYYNPLEPGGMGLNLNDYSYEFENGINLTLKMLEEKNKEGLELMKQGNYSEAWSILKKARENNIPKNISENLALDKSISEAKKQVEKIEKQQEEKRLADEKRRREQQIQNNQSSNENQPLSYYAGIYSNGQDLIRLNANGTGVFYMDYISSETVAVKWSVYKNKISLDPTDSEQKYLIFSQYLDFNIINGRSTLSHSTMGGTFIYEKR